MNLKGYGELVWTSAVNDCIADNAAFAKPVVRAIKRHTSGDWGDVDAEDKATNDAARKDGGRLLSAYRLDGVRFAPSSPWPGDDKVWIITEACRSLTTVLFPSEY